MKKYLLLTVLTALLQFGHAQAPQNMNYQAVVRDAQGAPLPSGTVVSVKFQIHDGSQSGNVVFTETTMATTNQFGLITLGIGAIGNLGAVNWASGAKYLQVLIDPAGGSNFSDMGTSQLLSVPYALFAGNSTGTMGATGATGLPGINGTNGATGVTGATGQQGIQGIQGVAGPTGVNGATGAAGVQGMQGVAGATGLQGAQGIAGPTGLQGLPGVAGPTGLAGVDGAAGATGIQGLQGTAGATGPQGAPGVTGPSGQDGANGATGATGLQGAQGIAGPTGLQGIQGVAGPSGQDGANGATGATGLQGAQGIAGPTGLQGIQGVAGPSGQDGANGATGATGLQGVQGIAGPTGLQGLPGVAGPSGQDGANGATGATGLQGAQGIAGPTGLQGLQGVAGPSGQDGANGATGATGLQGAQGIAGPTGLQGVQGVAGPSGQDGANGATGATGLQGLQGVAGPSGLNGVTGATGIQGVQGIAGPTGAQGITGATGQNGINGVTGATGLQGPTGAGGLNGTLNYVVKFTPNGITGGNSIIYDNGNAVGIGTASPGDTLTVNGSGGIWNNNKVNFYADNGITQKGFVGNYASGSDFSIASTGGTNWMRIGSNNGDIAFFPDNTAAGGLSPKVVFTPGGNVGIGNLTPGSLLTVNGNTQTVNFQMTNGATYGYLLQSDSNGNGSWVSPSAAGYWTLSGANLYNNSGTKLGIGTNTPGDTLTVNGTGGIWNSNEINFYADNGITQKGFVGNYASGSDFSIASTGGANWMRIGANNGNIAFFPDNTATGGLSPKVVFTPGGNVGIGTIFPGNTLTVNGGEGIWNGNSIDFYTNSGTTLKGFVGQTSATSDMMIASETNGNWMRIGANHGLIAFFPDSTVNRGLNPAMVVTGTGSGKVGINTTTPGDNLDVNGGTITKYIQISYGAQNGYLLQSDRYGNGTWVNPAGLATPNIYNTDGSLTGNRTVNMGSDTLTFNSTSGNFIFNPSTTGYMGIGTTTPTASLTVNGNGILATGSGPIPATGGGNRMMWYPAKASFRAGSALSNEWDDNNTGINSTAFGNNVVAPSFGEVAIGVNNSSYQYASDSIWVGTDRIFDVGTGSSPYQTYDAFTILKNGNIGIGTTTPSSKLVVAGKVTINDGSQSYGNVLTCDNNGVASWTNPSVVNPSFSVVGNYGQGVQSGNTINLQFNNINWDDAGGFSPAITTYEARSSGVYHFDVKLTWNGSSSGTDFLTQISIVVNSYVADNQYTLIPAATELGYGVSTYSGLVQLNAGDKVFVQLWQSNIVSGTRALDPCYLGCVETSWVGYKVN